MCVMENLQAGDWAAFGAASQAPERLKNNIMYSCLQL